MAGPLAGLRVVEAASFIAGPSCGLYFAQQGAEVIRIDPIGGGPDINRWPQAGNGASLYWEGLNKGKKSVLVDLTLAEGRDLALRIATAGGSEAGLFVTNFPLGGFFAHKELARLRPDIITLRIMGWADGTPAVDYTVNAAMGIPLMTGSAANGTAPVNSVLPAWDLLAGAYGAFALLGALHRRRSTGEGSELRLPLGDLASATLGHIGQIAEVSVGGRDRPRDGNDLYGAFGRDFATRDGARVMIVALTARQWRDLSEALGLGASIGSLEGELGVSFKTDEGMRYRHRDRLFPLFEAAIARHDYADLVQRFEGSGVCWAPYRTLSEAAAARDRFGVNMELMSVVDQPSGLNYPSPAAPVSDGDGERLTPRPAPRLGAHTDEVLADLLGLSRSEIGRLREAGIVA